MAAPVHSEAGGTREQLLADFATERLLARVRPDVLGEVTLVRKRFCAHRAGERLLPSVHPKVRCKRARRDECLVAIRTLNG